MLAGGGSAKVTSHRGLLYENFQNTEVQGLGCKTTAPRGENALGGELSRISNRRTTPILSQDRTRSLRFEIRKWAEVELKIIRAAAAVVVPRPAFGSEFAEDARCQGQPKQALKCNTNSACGASDLGFSHGEIHILPSRRRLWAHQDPPSFLPAPPACQSRVTSRDGWIPTWVEFLAATAAAASLTLWVTWTQHVWW